jgi:ornithine decarboxylase
LDAVLRARRVFDEAIETGFNLTLLDVGGGFPGANVGDGITFEKVAAVLGPAVNKYFPESIRVIAEPGRYYVASAFTLATHVIARRIVNHDGNPRTDAEPKGQAEIMYYLNDGLYSSFNCILFDHQTVYPEVLMRGGKLVFGEHFNEPQTIASIWGPTCDSIDCITKATLLPRLNVGDWLYFKNMGAYTITAASQFNGFQQSKVLYTNTAGW